MDFDTAALFAVVDEQLAARDMTVPQLVKQLAWTSKRAFLRMRESGPFAGCQFILPVIQWVGRTPESFMTGGADFPGELLPDPGSGRWRWYWDMRDLASALDVRRAERELTWAQVAEEFGSSSAEIKALQKTKYGMSIGFSMRAARWLDRTAASFMWEHDGLGLPWSGRRVDARPK